MKYKFPCPECKGTGKTLTPFADCVRGMKVEKCKKCGGFGWFESCVVEDIDLANEEGELI